MNKPSNTYASSTEQSRNRAAIEELRSRVKLYIMSQVPKRTRKERIMARVKEMAEPFLASIEDRELRESYWQELYSLADECYERAYSALGELTPLILSLIITDGAVDNNDDLKADIAVMKGKASRVELIGKNGRINATSADKYYGEVQREIEEFMKSYPELSEGKRYSSGVDPRNIAEMKIRHDKYVNDRKELEASGARIVYVPPHVNCSRRCQSYQGKLYSLDGTRGTVDGKEYVPIEEATDKVTYTTRKGKTYPAGLFSYNCRHTMVAYESGMVIETIPDEEIEERRSLEEKQRKMERAVRQERERAQMYKIIGEQSGNPTVKRRAVESRRRAAAMRREYEAFSKENNLAYYPERLKIVEGEYIRNRTAGKTDEALTKPAPTLEAIRSGEIKVADLTEGAKRDILKKTIDEGQITTNLNHEKQAPHILGSEMYDPKKNKSYFLISEKELQNIFDLRVGTGIIKIGRNGQIKETIEVDDDIAVNMNKGGTEKKTTNRMTVHYSKTRTHIVPSIKKEE